MPLEQQVCSLELAQKLKELGVKQESLFYWHRSYNPEKKVENEPYVIYSPYLDESKIDYSAFTVAELGEMLPWSFERDNKIFFLQQVKNGKNSPIAKEHELFYSDGKVEGGEVIPFPCITADTEADARGKMLIYLAENGLIDPKNI